MHWKARVWLAVNALEVEGGVKMWLDALEGKGVVSCLMHWKVRVWLAV